MRSQNSMSESAGAAGVVEVREPEVVAVLVGEHADAGVLGLHDVVRQPQAGVADAARRRRTVLEWAQIA